MTGRNAIVSHRVFSQIKGVLRPGLCAACLIILGADPIRAARLFHNDGTVVEGHILGETPDDVRIETKFGTFTYPKAELTKIQRDATPTPAPTPVDNTPPNFSTFVPREPVDPFAPPRVPLLFQAAAARQTPPPDSTPSPRAASSRQVPAETNILGTVERVSGDVVLRRENRPSPLLRGASLHPGDVVAAGAGKCALQLSGGRRVLVAGGSEVQLPRAVKPVAESTTLLKGVAWIEFPMGNTDSVEAAQLVAVNADPGNTGRVVARLEVTAGRRVRVASLEGTVIVHLAQGSETNPIRTTIGSGTQLECDLGTRSFGPVTPLESTLRLEYRGL